MRITLNDRLFFTPTPGLTVGSGFISNEISLQNVTQKFARQNLYTYTTETGSLDIYRMLEHICWYL